MAKLTKPETILEALDLSSIEGENARECIIGLLNLVEELAAENRELRAEVQRLRDEINRLKGEQGKPSIKPKRKKGSRSNYSSEKERQEPKVRGKRRKRGEVRIDREEELKVDRTVLPPDAESKGHEEVVVQDVVFRTDNVLFRKEVFYSPSEGKTYRAPLPAGYSGRFGPGVKALAITLYYGGGMSEPKILELLSNVGTEISAGQLSNMLIKGQENFHAEKEAVYEAGLRSSRWQHIDDTGTKVNGEKHHCHIMCNPLYTAYTTTPKKNRMTVLEVLWNQQPKFMLNEEAMAYLERVGLPATKRARLWNLPREESMDADTAGRLLDEHVPDLGPQQRKWVLEAMGVAAYHAQTEWPVVNLLVADDAGQFKWVTEELSLCWIHEGRHYKKLSPVVPMHRRHLEAFQTDFWKFYHELLAYREAPTSQEHARLDARFDELFGTVTGYAVLDDRIAKTRAKKLALLKVLEHPEIPLHNNPAELGARQRVRKRDVSFGPRVPDGVRAWDTFATLAETAKKLGVSFYDYVQDRVSAKNQMQALADLIDERAHSLNLVASWDSS